MGRLAVEGNKEIYFEDYAGEGRPLVLVHGWGMSCRTWDYNLPALRAAGHRVVSFDHRGCGHSDKDFEDVSIAAIAADVVALCDDRGLESPVLVGWSLGAAVSVEAAEQLGDRAGGLALIGTPSPRYLQAADWEIGGTPEAIEETAAALRTNRAAFLHDLTAGVFKNDPGPAMIEWMWSIFMETSPNADVSLIALGDLDHREMMPTLELPALLCVGAGDVIVDPRTSAKAAEMLPNARAVEFADSGHAPFLEEQEKFERELLDFLGGL
jgi:pimeloyl-ACP methyl ester carboxylesterase